MQFVFVRMIANGDDFVLSNPLFHLSTFLLGMGAGVLFKSKRQFLMNNIPHTLAFIGHLNCRTMLSHYYKKRSLQQVLPEWVISSCFCSFDLYIALSKQRIFSIFASPKLEYLGEISYGIYILQFPLSILVFGVIDRIGKLSPTISFCIYLPVLVSVAALTYECIEKPGRRMIRKSFDKKATA